MSVKVFLVDDASKVQGLLVDLLTGLGFEVVGTAGTEAEANLWVKENPGAWDLAIVDLLLEQGAGLSVVGKCREASAQGKVVVFSAYATPGVRKRCIELGADEVFDKISVAPLLEFCRGLRGAPIEM